MLNLTDIQPQKNEIYLDNNATTPVLPQAAKAAIHTMNACYGNPSSSHMTGIKAKYILESTRVLARKVTGASDGEIIFTSGATEGIQTSIISALNDARVNLKNIENPILMYGATEHKAVPETLKHWNNMLNIGAQVVAIPVDENGILDFDFIAEHAKDALMICTMAANNETGVFQDLAALEVVIRGNNPDVLWMVDCVQALGKIPLELSQTTIDYAPFSGHKLYAPKGIGFLYVRSTAPYTPFIAGGGQESGLRSGTENLPGIAALNAIFSLLNDENDDTFKSHETLLSFRDQLIETLNEAFPTIVYNHNLDYSLPTTLNFSVEGLLSKDIMDLFDAGRIRVSSGSACSSKVTGSFVLDAMGKSKWQSEGAIRLSFGPATTQKDIDDACGAIKQAVIALQSSCLIISDNNEHFDSDADGLQQWVYDQQCTWCYIDKEHKEIFIIDPIPELVNKFTTLVSCQDYSVKGIFATHLHADQINCSHMLREIMAEYIDDEKIDDLGWNFETSEYITLENEQLVEAISVGRHVLAKLPIPGHTENSVAYLFGKPEEGRLYTKNIHFVFVGDTLQIGGIGRSDFVSSNTNNLYKSLKLLSSVIAKNTLICPAHDYQQLFSTTLELEMNSNSILKSMFENDLDVNAFIEQKEALDQQEDNPEQAGQCGNIKETIDPSVDVNPGVFSDFLKQNPDIQVFDVREPHEYEAHHHHVISDHNILNVPLSQISDFVFKNQEMKKTQSYICICRSGSRSDAAARTLKRMGFEHVYHVPGGFALLTQ